MLIDDRAQVFCPLDDRKPEFKLNETESISDGNSGLAMFDQDQTSISSFGFIDLYQSKLILDL